MGKLEEYRRSLSRDGTKHVEEVKKWVSEEVQKYLSPYVLPRFLGDRPPQVARLLDNGHVTVIRLPLDGGPSRHCRRTGRSGKKRHKRSIRFESNSRHWTKPRWYSCLTCRCCEST